MYWHRDIFHFPLDINSKTLILDFYGRNFFFLRAHSWAALYSAANIIQTNRCFAHRNMELIEILWLYFTIELFYWKSFLWWRKYILWWGKCSFYKIYLYCKISKYCNILLWIHTLLLLPPLLAATGIMILCIGTRLSIVFFM